MKPIRVRFAPSPTGYLHLGGVRTALYNFLLARSQGGVFVLRIEDTDLDRSSQDFLKKQLEDLSWLGLQWDEGPHPETLEDQGHFGPYRQSERLHIYKQKVKELLEKNLAYYDFRTDSEMEALRNSKGVLEPQKIRPSVIPSLGESVARIEKGEKAAIRLKVEGSRDHWILDLVRGRVRLNQDMVGDFIIMRSNSMPVYNFCCAIDDALMEITHVLRAEEHLSNTVKQKLIYEALGYPLPQWGHLSIIQGPDKQKLSKRHGASSCQQYREMGFLPEALLNFMALLGWTPPSGQECLSIQELSDEFSLERFHTSAAILDREKLKWMNGVYLRKLPWEKLWTLLEPFLKREGLILENLSKDWIQKALSCFQEKMDTLQDGVPFFKSLDENFFHITPQGHEVLSWETTPSVLEVWKQGVQDTKGTFMSPDEFSKIQRQIKEKTGAKGKFLFMPIRTAVIGTPQGGDLSLLVPLISKHSLLKRLSVVL